MALAAGTTIGPYQIHSALGAGGMGEVYRARDSRLARDVALKVLPETFSIDPERTARFQREAQILAALSHPNIATVFGLEHSASETVLVMELVEGESLYARLKRGPLPLDEAVAIATQIGNALSAAHEKGIIHRDLKPANVIVKPDGQVKVLDFGLAKMVVLALADRTSVRFGDVTSAVHMEPALSPDGRWIVYQRGEQSGPYARTMQAFVEPFPASGAKYLVPVTPVAGHPQWTRMGDRLIINATATSSVAVDFHSAPSVAFGPPTDFPRLHRTEPNPLTGRRNSDAMPNGRLLGISIDLAAEGSGEAMRRDQIAVVLNWRQTVAASSGP